MRSTVRPIAALSILLALAGCSSGVDPSSSSAPTSSAQASKPVAPTLEAVGLTPGVAPTGFKLGDEVDGRDGTYRPLLVADDNRLLVPDYQAACDRCGGRPAFATSLAIGPLALDMAVRFVVEGVLDSQLTDRTAVDVSAAWGEGFGSYFVGGADEATATASGDDYYKLMLSPRTLTDELVADDALPPDFAPLYDPHASRWSSFELTFDYLSESWREGAQVQLIPTEGGEVEVGRDEDKDLTFFFHFEGTRPMVIDGQAVPVQLIADPRVRIVQVDGTVYIDQFSLGDPHVTVKWPEQPFGGDGEATDGD